MSGNDSHGLFLSNYLDNYRHRLNRIFLVERSFAELKIFTKWMEVTEGVVYNIRILIARHRKSDIGNPNTSHILRLPVLPKKSHKAYLKPLLASLLHNTISQSSEESQRLLAIDHQRDLKENIERVSIDFSMHVLSFALLVDRGIERQIWILIEEILLVVPRTSIIFF